MSNRLRKIRKPADLVKAYENGFEGVYSDPDEVEKLFECVSYRSGVDAASAYGLEDSAVGELVVPYKNIEMLWPTSMPGPAQTRGDCVSHSAKNSALTTLACEIVAGKPDEVTGKVEGPPKVSPEGEKNGVLSTEAIYWWRDHGGDGWGCHHASRVLIEESGMWVRQDYPQFGFNLTKYSGRLAGKWGRTSPPSKIKEFGLKHAIRDVTELSTFEECRDFLKNGYGISSCGGQGWSSRRDENGFSKRSGSWSHAMALIAADDRDITKRKYGEPLVCILNSWGRWNSGPRTILGTNLEIPHGAFWAKWSDCRRRSFLAMSGAEGWPPQKLPDWGADYWSRL